MESDYLQINIEVEQESGERWLAEVPLLAGVLAYGETQDVAPARVQALALRVLAERLEDGEVARALTS